MFYSKQYYREYCTFSKFYSEDGSTEASAKQIINKMDESSGLQAFIQREVLTITFREYRKEIEAVSKISVSIHMAI